MMDRSSSFKFHIVGAGRGGTSLLAGLIDAHPACRVIFEEYSLGYLMGRIQTDAERLARPADRIPARVQNFLNACEARALEAPELVWGHKATTEQIKGLESVGEQSHQPDRAEIDYSVSAFDALHCFAAAISDAKVLFILRDGRTCVRSKVKRTGQSFEEAIKRWKYSLRVLEALRAACADFLLLRFEDLVLRPEPNLEQICAFLRIGYDPVMLGGTNNPRMRDDYRRSGFDQKPTRVDELEPKYLALMRDDLVALGYL